MLNARVLLVIQYFYCVMLNEPLEHFYLVTLAPKANCDEFYPPANLSVAFDLLFYCRFLQNF